ncbi:CLUMA_CG006483, isoform A [Clunio marinus]|uniref:CLUMA_CG006483, isoform A n=1 Tax=Clunio marinus TaxID=568069 RepID=A0A1J1I426_9DIPT|nr:CLUMA_CG006483, isoform A [Clunio marinus]
MKAFAVLVLLSISYVLGSPVDVEEPIAPTFDAYRDVRILLITRQNLNNPQQLHFRNLLSVQQSQFRSNRPTRVLVHGWFEDDTSDIKVETAAELLAAYDLNVLFIDWSEGSRTINYIGARNRVPTVGTYIASYLDFLHENNLIQWNRVNLVGFSLGAHIAGMAGKGVRRGRINAIIGLDPAGPLFSVRTPSERLDANDANYVEVIHTNGPTLVLIGAGIGAAIGDADFWPNGGTSQPGCLTNTCSHGRAVDFYVESIRNNAFFALQCPGREDISSRRCVIQPGAWMGGDAINFDKALSGCFYLETNRNSPHAQGPPR